ncbi:MAG: disulfide bond formation protein B [Acetobacteraceae bacterium]
MAGALNLLGLLGLTAVQVAGFAFQFGLGELPCPLCLLQRVAFAMVAFGFLLNVRYGAQAMHYGIILLGALFGMSVAGRQVLLHIVPGSGAYGSAVLGMHFYTWAFLLFGATILATAVLLLLPGEAPVRRGRWAAVAVYVAIAVTAANAATTFAECGPIECPDDPVGYWLLTVLRGG